ncbi:GNAT family N-acetyltransferase [Sphingomonas sp. R647]|uniref:GNAT family N-acetyltransferase n=1 Tax=Sphingomonas sp. R647 TaxID=2875233 RepID=UPI001CD2EE43|nr:GNAT family N-acetyltransferase [Sphingomonas sp. R647]MCA1199406.1 GNAT family N-acetyltransferase [Sphingomonas sp. R647]
MSHFETDPAAAFDAAFGARAGDLQCRPRTSGDVEFLIACAIACSPMQGLLSEAMLVQQAEFQRAAHDAAHPDAMHRIVTRDGAPIGHILVAWHGAGTHLVDIAVRPEHRGIGAGGHLLAAWLAAADANGLTATLEVQVGNPARQIYERLGFVETEPDPWAAFAEMHRAPVQR